MDRGHSPKRRKLDEEEYSIAPQPKFRKPNRPRDRNGAQNGPEMVGFS